MIYIYCLKLRNGVLSAALNYAIQPGTSWKTFSIMRNGVTQSPLYLKSVLLLFIFVFLRIFWYKFKYQTYDFHNPLFYFASQPNCKSDRIKRRYTLFVRKAICLAARYCIINIALRWSISVVAILPISEIYLLNWGQSWRRGTKCDYKIK